MKKNVSAPLIVFLIKAGPKILSVVGKAFKSAKVIKVGLATASFGAYSLLFSWKFALMVMILLIVHEGGHLWAMKRWGMKTKGMYFIPMLGAAAVADDEWPSCEAESTIALAGPIAGLLMAAGIWIAWWKTGLVVWGVVCGWLALVNLINLLPVMPLDGGRVLRSTMFSLNDRIGLVVTVLCLVVGFLLFMKMKFYLFLFLLPIGFFEIMAMRRKLSSSREKWLELNRQWRKRKMHEVVKQLHEILRADFPQVRFVFRGATPDEVQYLNQPELSTTQLVISNGKPFATVIVWYDLDIHVILFSESMNPVERRIYRRALLEDIDELVPEMDLLAKTSFALHSFLPLLKKEADAKGIPVMSRWKVAAAGACYFIIIGVSYLILWSSSGIPAAMGAWEILK